MRATESRNPLREDFSTDEARWEAVLKHNQSADGQFVFAVRTTGIYCRPGCASRIPKRENALFFNTARAAEQAGFRACKRCQPAGPGLAERYAEKVAEACRAIETSETSPTLDELAKAAGMSRFHFHRVFTRVAGLTPKAYGLAHRAERVRRALPGRRTITEAIFEAGYNSNSRFYADSSAMLGMRPKKFRAGGAGEIIQWSTSPCSLGFVLIAASGRGICAIFLGDDTKGLRTELQERFPKATLVDGAPDFKRTVAAVVKLVESPEVGLDLPLDVRGTAFQRRVWQALRNIPTGKTWSYSEVARQIGAPKAVRAVAGACAANPIAVAIPCHRVVHLGGSLAGYRWGLQRKRALLEHEKRRSPQHDVGRE
jgi:AraC family transcriptional regulator, regulatory protein of adaptative response / methylated-DNA-[protein]-cysteine methyltransferase